MADAGNPGSTSGGGSGGLGGKAVVGVAGAAIGSAVTLIVKVFETTGVQQLLKDNPYVGVTVLALLAALVVIVLGLTLSRAVVGAVCAGGLVLTAMLFWFVAPLGFDVPLQAVPEMAGVPAIRAISPTSDDVDLAWNKPIKYHAERQHKISLNVQPVKDYYAEQLKGCVNTVKEAATGSLALDLSKSAY